MKCKELFICIILTVLASGCVKPSIDYDDFDWIYYDTESMWFAEYYLPGSNCEYLVFKDSSLINIKSECLERCVVLNEVGEVIDSCRDIDKSKLLRMRGIDSLQKFNNRFEIRMMDTSIISYVQYYSFLDGNSNLLTREMPNRIRMISFEMNGKEYSFKLRDIDVLNDIYQYNSKKVLISTRSNFSDISSGRVNNYVIMLDLEKMTKRRLFGIILE